MNSPESLSLICRAKRGDRGALEALYARYYPRWLRRWKGKLGKDLRRLDQTEDIVHSGLKEALQDMGDLRTDRAFFRWADEIIRRKIVARRKRVSSRKEVPLEDRDLAQARADSSEIAISDEDERKLLQAVRKLEPQFPVPMKAIQLKYFEKLSISGIAEHFGKSERSIHRLIETGLALLRASIDKTRIT